MKFIFFVFAMMFSMVANAQLYPLVENGHVIHMKESKFYSENNYGGYIIKGCNIIYRERDTNARIMVPLDMMIRYDVDGKRVKVVTSIVIPFEPSNIDAFVNGLMSHRHYCINQYLLQSK